MLLLYSNCIYTTQTFFVKVEQRGSVGRRRGSPLHSWHVVGTSDSRSSNFSWSEQRFGANRQRWHRVRTTILSERLNLARNTRSQLPSSHKGIHIRINVRWHFIDKSSRRSGSRDVLQCNQLVDHVSRPCEHQSVSFQPDQNTDTFLQSIHSQSSVQRIFSFQFCGSDVMAGDENSTSRPSTHGTMVISQN